MLRQVVGLVVIVLALGVGVPLVVESTSVATAGTVTAKQEAIVMGRGDSWIRAFTVTYRYRPNDTSGPETASHHVDFDTYQRLRVGSAVTIRYSASKFLRLFEGFGSYIDGTSIWSRLLYQGVGREDWLVLVGFGAAALLGWASYRLKSALLGVCAVTAAGVGYPIVLLFANTMLVVPMLFWKWRKQPGGGYGWMLLLSMVATIAVPYWRVPHASELPAGARSEATAVVRRVKSVDRIWTSGGQSGSPPARSSGNRIGTPFYMVDLEFTPAAASAPVHAVDTFDIASKPALKAGDAVPIAYSSADPRQAQVIGVTRTYDQSIFNELMRVALPAAVLFTVAIPVFMKISGLFNRLTNNAIARNPEEAIGRIEQRLEMMPPGDPRRERLEAYLQAQRSRVSQGRTES